MSKQWRPPQVEAGTSGRKRRREGDDEDEDAELNPAKKNPAAALTAVL